MSLDPGGIKGASRLQPLATIPLSASSQSALWAPHLGPDNALLVTTFDSRLFIYRNLGRSGSGTDAQPCPSITIRHDTKTGRWVVPFRAVWAAGGSGVLVGGMKRTADVYDAANGTRFSAFSSEDLTAIPSRNAAHPTLPVLACGTNSGRLHIFRR